MIPQLNQEQSRAVLNPAGKYAVIASAGAGKTRVLVEKFLNHVVDQQLRPDEILTITFTRKAAAEMKKRIVDRLRDLGRNEDAQIAETGPISTIHGFCERLLRENALAARIDPRFEVIQNPQTDLILRETVQQVLVSDLTQDPSIERFLIRQSGKSGYKKGPILDEQIKDAVLQTLNTFRSSHLGYDQIAAIYESPHTLKKAAQNQFSAQNPAYQAIVNQTPDYVESLQRLKSLKKAERGNANDWLPSPLDPELEEDSMNESWALGTLTIAVWQQYESKLIKAQSFDFNLLESMAVRLLEQNPEVQIRLQNQYKAMLVDETQDVNPTQFRLLDTIKIDATMLVGDPQQSIYGFRGADPTLFADRAYGPDAVALKTNYRTSPSVLAFINDFFDSVWPSKYGSMSLPPAKSAPELRKKYQGVELWQQPALDSTETAKKIHQLVQEGTPAADIAVLVQFNNTAAAMAEAINQTGIRAVVHGGSTRFYARMESRDMANALKACAEPRNDFALAALLLSPYVGLSLDSIVLAHRKQSSPLTDQQSDSDKQSLLEKLTQTTLPEADQPKFKRFLEWFTELSSLADRLPAWETISELLHQTDYMVNVATTPGGAQTLANVRKLLTLASQQPELMAKEYADLVRQTVEFNHRETDANTLGPEEQAVSVMTMHNAKGLEFPTVVLPDVFSNIDYLFPGPAADQSTGLVALTAGTGKSCLHEFLKNKTKLNQRQEKLRLLYVAMTRAQSRLCLTVSPHRSNKGQSLSDVIRNTVNFPDQHPSIHLRASEQNPNTDPQEPTSTNPSVDSP